LKISYDWDTEAVELAATNQVPNAMMEIFAASKKLDSTDLEIPKKIDTANKPQPTEEMQVKAIDLRTGNSSKTTMIGAGLDLKYEDALISFLRANRNIFEWKPADMLGVPRRLIEHSLNIDPKDTPKRQHLRHFVDVRRDAIKKENAKQLTVSFIPEVFHPEWLANSVLNKHYPRTPSCCRELIKSSTPRRAATCSASSTATLATTRSVSRKNTRRKSRSSPCSDPTATRQCRSD
jgi:hypothetical protein